MVCRSDGDCDFIFSYEDYTSDIINTIYGHIF